MPRTFSKQEQIRNRRFARHTEKVSVFSFATGSNTSLEEPHNVNFSYKTISEPILPDIVRHIKGVPEFLQGDKYNKIMNQTIGNVTFFGPAPTSSLAVGILFSAKPFTELISNPLVGCAVDKWV